MVEHGSSLGSSDFFGQFVDSDVLDPIARRLYESGTISPLGALTLVTHHDLIQARLDHYKDAMFDALTGARSRRAFAAEFPEMLATANRSDTLVGVWDFDLDGFKERNDTRGHAEGDVALQIFARTIGEVTRLTDPVYRMGGDEFRLLTPGISSKDTPEHTEQTLMSIARKVSDAMNAKFNGELGVSIGVTLTDGSEDPGEVVKRADSAMYECKNAHEKNHDKIVVIR